MSNFVGSALTGLVLFFMNRSRSAPWLIAFLVTAPLLVYLPSVLRNGFVSIDDSLLITGNASVQSLSFSTLAHIFTSYDPELYIPLALLTYQIEWALVGAQPILFHSTNLLLHMGSGIFLFLLLKEIFGARLIAFFGALLFVLHPIHTEAVAWAAARKDVLSAFFFFGSLFFYEYGFSQRRDFCNIGASTAVRRHSFLSVVFFLLALLSKVTVSLLPVVLILLDWRRDRRIDAKNLHSKVPYFALSALFIIIALFGKAQGIGSLGLWKATLLSAKAIIFYLQKLLWPSHLSVLYSQQTPVVLSSAEFMMPALILCALIAVIAILCHRRFRNPAFGLSFFLLTLLPNFANFWKNRLLFFASDRYAYIPSVGLIIVVCAGGLWLTRRSGSARPAVWTAFSTVAAVFAALTFLQTGVWQTDFALYDNVLRWYPASAQAANNLGDAYVKAGRTEYALRMFSRAVENDNSYIQAMVNAGNVERERGNFDAARAWYDSAIERIAPDPRREDLAPRYLLGELLIKMGNTEEGLSQFRLAVEALPSIAEPRYNLAVQLHALGRGDAAIPIFEQAIALDPDHTASRYHLAGLYAERGRLAEAKIQLEEIVRLDPGYEKAAEHLRAIRALLSGSE